MFGRKAIRNLPRLVHAGGNDRQAIAIERLARNGIVAAALLRFCNDLLSQIGARGDEDGQRLRVMLGLRYKVTGNIARITALAGNDDFGRPSQHVDGAVEGHQTLGRCDIEITRPNDLVHTRQLAVP